MLQSVVDYVTVDTETMDGVNDYDTMDELIMFNNGHYKVTDPGKSYK